MLYTVVFDHTTCARLVCFEVSHAECDYGLRTSFHYFKSSGFREEEGWGEAVFCSLSHAIPQGNMVEHDTTG